MDCLLHTSGQEHVSCSSRTSGEDRMYIFQSTLRSSVKWPGLRWWWLGPPLHRWSQVVLWWRGHVASRIGVAYSSTQYPFLPPDASLFSTSVLASLNSNFTRLLLLGRDVKRESKRPLPIFQPFCPLEVYLHRDLGFLTSYMWVGQLKLNILPPVSWKLLWSGHSPPSASGSSGVCQGGDEWPKVPFWWRSGFPSLHHWSTRRSCPRPHFIVRFKAGV